MKALFPLVGVIGAGAMGTGIAQLAAQAGSTVLFYDTRSDAVSRSIASLAIQWDKLSAKGKLTPAQVTTFSGRLQPVTTLSEFSLCDLVIEAVVEQLDVKRALFAELEQFVRPDTVLATNTSSLSVTATAAGLK